MSVVANVAINVDAKDAVRSLNSVDDAVGKLDTKTGGLQKAFGGLNTALAALGLSALTKDLASAGIDADRTARRIKNLGDANGETAKVFAIAGKAAKEFGLGNVSAQKGIADLYGRLRPTGVALKDIETTFYGVNKAANAAGLTAADTDGVFLQLSQAMGSGALQGDELRSIMERLPAVGQAVAKVMGVTVGEVKQLGADGLITTDIMIKAAEELNKLKPPPPDAYKQFNAALENLRTEFGENLLPLLTPLVQGLVKIMQAFGALPEPVQTVLVGLAAISAAIIAIGSAAAFLAPVVAGFKAFAASMAIGPAIVALKAAFAGLIAWVGGTFLPAILAIFSGPVGWTVLAIAAVVAMAIAFREPIMKFFSWLGGAVMEGVKVLWEWTEPFRQAWVNAFNIIKGIVEWGLKAAFAIVYQLWVQPWVNLWNNVLRTPITAMANWLRGVWQGISKAFNNYVSEPIKKGWNAITELLPKAMQRAADFVQKVWTGMVNTVKSVIRGLLQMVANAINAVGRQVNRLIGAFNKLPGPDIPFVPTLSVPAFANGGVVTKPTLALVGDGGEPEYIVPQSKAAEFAQSWLSGMQNNAAGGAGTANINVQTGPVMQFEGQQYVTIADLERAMRITADGVIGRLRTPAARQALGMA